VLPLEPLVEPVPLPVAPLAPLDPEVLLALELLEPVDAELLAVELLEPVDAELLAVELLEPVDAEVLAVDPLLPLLPEAALALVPLAPLEPSPALVPAELPLPSGATAFPPHATAPRASAITSKLRRMKISSEAGLTTIVVERSRIPEVEVQHRTAQQMWATLRALARARRGIGHARAGLGVGLPLRLRGGRRRAVLAGHRRLVRAPADAPHEDRRAGAVLPGQRA